MIGRLLRRCVLTVVVCGVTASAGAQQRPLVTEDPETIGTGLILIEGGFDYARNQRFTVSGLEGHLTRLPLVGLNIGVSSIAEIQLDGLSYSRLRITDRIAAPLSDMLSFEGDRTRSVDDLIIGTKVHLVAESRRRPAFGVRFATRLPNASNEAGLGLDTTDFFATVLVGKTIQSVRIVGNVGVGILGDPTRGDRQNDVLLYGASVARAVAQGLELVGELNGRMDTREDDPLPGTENQSVMRLGARYTRGAVRIDGAILSGITSRDPSFGLTAGFTWVFEAFQIP